MNIKVGDIVKNFGEFAVIDMYREDIDTYIAKGLKGASKGKKWPVDPAKCEIVGDII